MGVKEQLTMETWVRNWQELGPILERLRQKEYRSNDLAEVLLSLGDATESTLTAYPPQPFSGIIEMQRLFAKLRANETGS